MRNDRYTVIELYHHLQIFLGNTNNAGVKFNFLLNAVSTRHVQIIPNNLRAYQALRIEIYGQPQGNAVLLSFKYIFP